MRGLPLGETTCPGALPLPSGIGRVRRMSIFPPDLAALPRAIAGALAFTGAVALASPLAAEPAMPQFGPVAFASSLEEIRAALPQAQWHTLATLPSGAPSTLTAANVMEFGGQRAHIWVMHKRYDRGLVLDTTIESLTAQQCVEQSGAWFRAARAAVGEPLRAQPPRIVTQPTRTTFNATRIDGNLVVLPQSSGGGSTTFGEQIAQAPDVSALLDARNGDRPWPQKKWARRAPDTFTLSASTGDTTLGAPRTEVTAEYDVQRCRLRIDVGMSLPPPAPTPYAFDTSRVKKAPSIALRHRIMLALQTPDPVGAPLTAPLTDTVHCSLDRFTGLTLGCKLSQETPPLARPRLKAFRELAMAYIFDMAGVDPDDPQEMTVAIPITLDPADVRSYAFLDKPADATGRVRLTRQPEILSGDYPAVALRDGIETEVTVKCEVQADQSVICAGVRAGNAAHAALFRLSALNAMSGVRVERELTSGGTSAGAVFETKLHFRLSQ